MRWLILLQPPFFAGMLWNRPQPFPQIKYYAIIEICMWLPTTWLVCFRFQPAIRFYSTDTGRKVVHHGANFLERWIPSAHASLMKLAGRIYGSPSGRTTAEWLLINKVILVDGEVVASQLYVDDQSLNWSDLINHWSTSRPMHQSKLIKHAHSPA